MTAALALLARVPPVVWLLLGLGAYGVYEHHRAASVTTTFTEAKAEAAAERKVAASAAAAETTRRVVAQKASVHRATQETARAAGHAASAADTGRRLRDTAVAVAASPAASDPAADAQCAPVRATAGVLADVLGLAERRAEVLAREADTARIAGADCERQYDSLTFAPIQPISPMKAMP